MVFVDGGRKRRRPVGRPLGVESQSRYGRQSPASAEATCSRFHRRKPLHDLATRAYAEFGRERHPAALNMGDCFAYACAKANGAKLLFKGEDLAKTDITPDR